MKLLVVPEARRQAAQQAVAAALVEGGGDTDFAFTLIRLPGTADWRVHVTGAGGENRALALLIQRKLKEAGL